MGRAGERVPTSHSLGCPLEQFNRNPLLFAISSFSVARDVIENADDMTLEWLD